jgi:hypothetical protein
MRSAAVALGRTRKAGLMRQSPKDTKNLFRAAWTRSSNTPRMAARPAMIRNCKPANSPKAQIFFSE